MIAVISDGTMIVVPINRSCEVITSIEPLSPHKMLDTVVTDDSRVFIITKRGHLLAAEFSVSNLCYFSNYVFFFGLYLVAFFASLAFSMNQ